MKQKYEKVELLVKAVSDLGLRIEKSPKTIEPDGHFYQFVRLLSAEDYIDFPMMDEFSDIEIGKPAVLLNFILQECMFFEEAQDFDEWCKDIGVPKDRDSSKFLYEELKNKVPKIRSILGFKTKSIDCDDIEFNTSITQALRATSL